jgi:hypothetical protein
MGAQTNSAHGFSAQGWQLHAEKLMSKSLS